MEKGNIVKQKSIVLLSKLKMEHFDHEKRKKGKKVLIVLIILHTVLIFLSFFTSLLSFSSIVFQIVSSLVGIANIVGIGWLILLARKKEQQEEIPLPKYDPILLHFLRTNEVSVDENMLLAELLDLVDRGYVSIENQESERADVKFHLQQEQSFKRIGSLMKIEPEQMESYGTQEIVCYENVFVMKILFPNGHQVSWQEIKRNQKTSFYQDRLELCRYPLEKMLVHELEKRELIEKSGRDKLYLGLLFLNMLLAILYVFSAGGMNIILILGILLNLLFSVWCIKEEKILSYELTEDTQKQLKQIEKVIKEKQVEEFIHQEIVYAIALGGTSDVLLGAFLKDAV